MPAPTTEETHMDLLLWRHAEAEDGTPDAKRKLTEHGKKQAERMAAWIRQHAPKKLHVIVSPAIRCQQTAQALGLPFDTDPRVGTDRDVSELLAAVGWPNGGKEKCRAVLVVGHQPTLGRLAALLLSGSETNWTIKKGALWWFSNRTRLGDTQTILRASLTTDLAD